jgi:hypothetical protein
MIPGSLISTLLTTGSGGGGGVAVASQYWRVMGVGDDWGSGMGNNFIEAAEIQMFESVDCTGTNICIGATASASTTYPGGYYPSLANDGNTSTFWASASFSPTPEWWSIALSSPKTVRSLVFIPRTGFGGWAPRTAKLQYSTDNSTWTDVGSIFNFGQNANDYVTSVQNIQSGTSPVVTSPSSTFTQNAGAWTINGNSATTSASSNNQVLHGPVVAVGTYIDVTLDTGNPTYIGFLGLSSSRADWAYPSTTNNYVAWYWSGAVWVNGTNTGAAPSYLSASRYRIAFKAGGAVAMSKVSSDGATLQGTVLTATLGSELADTHLILFGQAGYPLCNITYNTAGSGSGGL